MNRLFKMIIIFIMPVIVGIIVIYMADFNENEWILSIIIWVLSIITTNIYEEKQGILGQCDEKDKEIENLKNRLTQMSIYANDNSPYTIQLFIKELGSKLKKGNWYEVEIIVSTIDKLYDISYLNISFDSDVEIDRISNNILDNYYSIYKLSGMRRIGLKEFNFFIKDEHVSKIIGKSIFKLKFNTSGIVNMSIEIVGEKQSTVRMIKNIELNIV